MMAPSLLLPESIPFRRQLSNLLVSRFVACDGPCLRCNRSDLPLDGTSPMLLSMYGAYGMPMEVSMCL